MSSTTCTVALLHFLNACALNIFLRVQHTDFFFMKNAQSFQLKTYYKYLPRARFYNQIIKALNLKFYNTISNRVVTAATRQAPL